VGGCKNLKAQGRIDFRVNKKKDEELKLQGIFTFRANKKKDERNLLRADG